MPSKEKLESNKEIVRGLADELKAAKGVVLVDYRGINVSQDTELRASLRKAGVNYHVVKNTMTTFAARDAGLDGLLKSLLGPTAMATSAADPVAPAKIMSEYAKKIESLKIKAGVVEGNVIDESGVASLAQMPSKEQLLSMLLGALKAPAGGLATVLSANVRGLVTVLDAVREKRQAQEPGQEQGQEAPAAV
ncbi:MAG: 50S ribosomal protein L10 [Clostridiales bacterium]|jgi:large subunit ribosomal protein L10|nr:50S ribosomal protein L10 [Clostridiales bacterium]